MATSVLDFPTTSSPQGNSRPVLVQLKLGRDFVNAIDIWRRSRSAPLPRTHIQAIVELTRLGLAGETLGAIKAAKRRKS